jgi:hypothetical protein
MGMAVIEANGTARALIALLLAVVIGLTIALLVVMHHSTVKSGAYYGVTADWCYSHGGAFDAQVQSLGVGAIVPNCTIP